MSPALPGFTRSAFHPHDHALITPESRTWSTVSAPGWANATAAHVASPALGARFTMALVSLGAGGVVGPPHAPDVDRVVYVLGGEVDVGVAGGGARRTLRCDGFVFAPARGPAVSLASASGASLLLYEAAAPPGHAGDAASTRAPIVAPSASALRTVDPGGGETFTLRKLLPPAAAAFNVHVMDFEPGEYLVTKEAHHNEHGLLLVEGRGVYRLGEKYYAVTAGDAIWMAPYTLQWYGALGTGRSRYVIYKNTNEAGAW